VSEREVGVQRERAVERLLREREKRRWLIAPFPRQPVTAAQAGPGGREARIVREALAIQITRVAPAALFVRNLVRSKVRFVRRRARGRALSLPLARCDGHRVDNAPGEIILQGEEIV
jgi:hypothetical protein